MTERVRRLSGTEQQQLRKQRERERIKQQRQRLIRTMRPLDYQREQHTEMELQQFMIFPEGDELALTLVTSAGSATIMLEKDLAACLSRCLKRAVLERKSFTVSLNAQAESSPGRR